MRSVCSQTSGLAWQGFCRQDQDTPTLCCSPPGASGRNRTDFTSQLVKQDLDLPKCYLIFIVHKTVRRQASWKFSKMEQHGCFTGLGFTCKVICCSLFFFFSSFFGPTVFCPFLLALIQTDWWELNRPVSSALSLVLPSLLLSLSLCSSPCLIRSRFIALNTLNC